MRPCRIANSSRCPWSSIYGKLAQEHIYWDKYGTSLGARANSSCSIQPSSRFLRESAPERVSIPRSRQIATEAVRIKAPMTCAAKARSLIAHSGSMCQDDD